MADVNFSELLGNPLSEITRKERRNLLFASTAGIAIAKMEIVPTKLSMLGVDFLPPAQSAFLVLVAVVVAYFIFAFIIYGIADFFVWRKKYQDYRVAQYYESQGWSIEEQRSHDELYENVPRDKWLYNWLTPVAFIRLTFEFLIPVVSGMLAIFFLINSWR